jgi:hypothetical protein
MRYLDNGRFGCDYCSFETATQSDMDAHLRAFSNEYQPHMERLRVLKESYRHVPFMSNFRRPEKK